MAPSVPRAPTPPYGHSSLRAAQPGPLPPTPDPGLANERTALAWTRTALSLAATGALVVRLGLETPIEVGGDIAGGVIIAGGAAAWVAGQRGYRSRSRCNIDDLAAPARPLAFRLLALGSTAVGLVAFVLSLLTL